MSEDASLDQFLSGGDDAEAGESDPSPDESDAGDDPAADDVASSDDSASVEGTEPTDGGDVTPAVTTYAWSAEGAACGVCGEAVERRWQQDGSLVCFDCKEWDRS